MRGIDLHLKALFLLPASPSQKGQLGHGDFVNRNNPKIVEELKGKFIVGGALVCCSVCLPCDLLLTRLICHMYLHQLFERVHAACPQVPAAATTPWFSPRRAMPMLSASTNRHVLVVSILLLCRSFCMHTLHLIEQRSTLPSDILFLHRVSWASGPSRSRRRRVLKVSHVVALEFS